MKGARYIALAVALLVAVTASAQPFGHTGEPERKVRMEMGVGLDAAITGIREVSNTAISLSPRIGFGGHFDMAVCIGRNFAIEAEVGYQKGSLMAKLGNSEHKVKTTTMDLPLLFSLRMLGSRLRLNLGPMFTLMSKAQYMADNTTMEFGNLHPTVSLAGGVAVCLGGHFQVEARYIHELKETLNQYQGEEFTTRGHRITVGFAVIF